MKLKDKGRIERIYQNYQKMLHEKETALEDLYLKMNKTKKYLNAKKMLEEEKKTPNISEDKIEVLESMVKLLAVDDNDMVTEEEYNVAKNEFYEEHKYDDTIRQLRKIKPWYNPDPKNPRFQRYEKMFHNPTYDYINNFKEGDTVRFEEFDEDGNSIRKLDALVVGFHSYSGALVVQHGNYTFLCHRANNNCVIKNLKTGLEVR